MFTMIVFAMYFGNNVAIDHIEFYDRAQCEAARPVVEEMKAANNLLLTVRTACVQSGRVAR